MKIARFDGGRIGVVIDGTVCDVTAAAGTGTPAGVGQIKASRSNCQLWSTSPRKAGAKVPAA